MTSHTEPKKKPFNCQSNPCPCNKQERPATQWETLIKTFSVSHQEICKNPSMKPDLPTHFAGFRKLPTDSEYEGNWDALGMSGHGVYNFKNGVVYEGDFKDGMFHGYGELRYPNGAVMRGLWREGETMERTLIFDDGLEYSESNWRYCKKPDRRFSIEYDKNLAPATESYLTADQPTRSIPPGHYDTGDGFYEPKSKVIYQADSLSNIVRCPNVREQEWIIKNCRTNPIPTLGAQKELYEKWTEPDMLPRNIPEPPVSYHRADPKPYYPDYEDDDEEIGFRYHGCLSSSVSGIIRKESTLLKFFPPDS